MIIQKLPSDGSPLCVVTPQQEADLFLLSQIIQVGDTVQTKSSRKLEKNDKVERKVLTLQVKVDKLVYEPLNEEISVSGKISAQNEFVAMGQQHTLHIFMDQSLTVMKLTWDEFDLKELSENEKPQSQRALCVLSREGVCSFAHMFDDSYVFMQRIEGTIPGKTRFNAEKIGNAQLKFFQKVENYCRNSLTKVNELVIAGHQDAVQQLATMLSNLKTLQVKAIPTKNVNLGRAAGEVFQNADLNQGLTQNFEQFRKQLLINPKLVAFGNDVLQVMQEHPQSLLKVLIAKKSLRIHPKRPDIFKLLENCPVVSMVPQNSSLSLQVESFGGFIALLDYELYLENRDPKIGTVYDGYDVWE